jgi:methyl-accepting chemotaxis protein
MNELAQGATETAGAVDRAVREAEGVSSQVDQTLTAAQRAMSRAKESGEAVASGRQALQAMVERMNAIASQGSESLSRMNSLRQSSTEIGQITQIISSIAEQTNLLALNAAIEAARAGEHGRGFAVVAEEVRKLAEQSQQAVKRISGLIGNIQVETDQLVQALEKDSSEIQGGTQATEGAQDSFAAISQAATAIDTEVQDILVTADTLNKSSQVMTKAMEEISSVTEETAASAEEVGANAQEQAAAVQEINRLAQDLTDLAQDLLNRVSQFKIEDEDSNSAHQGGRS